jgi:hypothetical protein
MDHADESAITSDDAAANSPSVVGPALMVVAVIALVLGAPLAAALALHRRVARRHAGRRPFRWGYYFSIQSLVAGTCLGMMLESGASVVIVLGILYTALAWFFAQRRHWAWIALTILSFNPVLRIVNFIYLRKRWAEDSLAAPV